MSEPVSADILDYKGEKTQDPPCSTSVLWANHFILLEPISSPPTKGLLESTVLKHPSVPHQLKLRSAGIYLKANGSETQNRTATTDC